MIPSEIADLADVLAGILGGTREDNINRAYRIREALRSEFGLELTYSGGE